MKKILEFSDYMDDLDLNPEQQAEIRNWLKKYEKYLEIFCYPSLGNKWKQKNLKKEIVYLLDKAQTVLLK